MIIRDVQIKAFEQAAIDKYITDLADHCRAFSPRLCETLREQELRAALRQGLVWAEEHGFTQRGPARFYIDMMILLGSGFDTDPQYPWTAGILARKDTQMERAEALHARAHSYLVQVDGADNAHTLKALEDLTALCPVGVTFRSESFEQDLLLLMTRIHPRKVAETGDRALRRLIAGASAKALERYGFRAARSLALVAILMVAFGHNCDSDPLLPWIARTLGQIDPADPDATATSLERQALTWLNGVLRNAEVNK